jgi:hypothetical protein
VPPEALNVPHPQLERPEIDEPYVKAGFKGRERDSHRVRVIYADEARILKTTLVFILADCGRRDRYVLPAKSDTEI